MSQHCTEHLYYQNTNALIILYSTILLSQFENRHIKIQHSIDRHTCRRHDRLRDKTTHFYFMLHIPGESTMEMSAHDQKTYPPPGAAHSPACLSNCNTHLSQVKFTGSVISWWIRLEVMKLLRSQFTH